MNRELFNLELTAGNMKAAMKESGATSSDLWKVPRASIRVIEGFNVRNPEDPEYVAHVRMLADSIKANGFYPDKPLSGFVAREDGVDVIYLTDGHSRLAGGDLAVSEGSEIDTYPVVVKPRGTSMEDLTVALYTSNTGKPLTPIETAAVCKRLVGYGLTEKAIATRLNLTKRYVDDLLALIGAPTAVRTLVTTGQVSASNAISAIREHGDKAASKLNAAVDTAQAQGGKKATAKHMGKPKKLSPTQALLQGFREKQKVASLEGSIDALTDETRMPDDDMLAIRWALSFTPGSTEIGFGIDDNPMI